MVRDLGVGLVILGLLQERGNRNAGLESGDDHDARRLALGEQRCRCRDAEESCGEDGA
jgi:hypothetical protein